MSHHDEMAHVTIQMVKIKLKKKVKFSLEGGVPEVDPAVKRSAIPKLPLPGELVERLNILKIRKSDIN